MRLVAVFFVVASLAAAQRPLLWERRHNTFLIEVGKRPMEIELSSESAFAVRRGLAGPPKSPYAEKLVECDAAGTAAGVRLKTSELSIEVSNESGLITVSLLSGVRLLRESAARVAEGKASLSFTLPPSEMLYGLGARSQPSIDGRGLALRPNPPSFISSQGYAFWIGTPGVFNFDAGKTVRDRLAIDGEGLERLEYFVAFGPSAKEIWEDRWKIAGTPNSPATTEVGFIRSSRLPKGAATFRQTGVVCEDARAMVHASLSGMFLPALDLAPYRKLGDAALKRAGRLGIYSPILFDSSVEPPTESQRAILDEIERARKRLEHYLIVYSDEVRARGYPVIHPLLMQFPRDPIAGQRVDAYMLGDELLIAPFCDGVPKREVYLPMGVWTDWASGQSYAGRRGVELDAPEDGLRVLAKSGSVVPLNGVNPGDPTELHYFPKNGGEFFIYEPDAADYTQAHAGPAADIYRLEMESKVDRRYEWVVHHLDKPKSVALAGGNAVFEETSAGGPVEARKWRYDTARRTVHVGVAAKAHTDIIVNLIY